MAEPSQRDWLSIGLAFAGIVLGSGLFGPSIVSFISEPNVQIIGPTLINNGYKASFQMFNFGATAAKHLMLTIKTPLKIKSYSSFSTENMSLVVNKTSGTVVGNLIRFAQGDGSYVMINLTLVPNPKVHFVSDSAYKAYVTYDQGSAYAIISLPLHLQVWLSLLLYPVYFLLAIVGYVLIILLLYLFLKRLKRIKRQKKEIEVRRLEWGKQIDQRLKEREIIQLETELQKNLFSSFNSESKLSDLAQRVLDEYANMRIDADLKNSLISSIFYRINQLNQPKISSTPGGVA
jgi:hypothetical protein